MGILGSIGNVLGKIPQILGLVGTAIGIVEKIGGIFHKGEPVTGEEKKAAALALIHDSIEGAEIIAKKDIVDDDLFESGLSKVIDGFVDMLNASLWYKKKI